MSVPAWVRRLSGYCLILLVALLPALLAGIRVDSPPVVGEWSLIQEATSDVPPSLVTAAFVQVHVDMRSAAELPAPGSDQAMAVLAKARLSQVWGLLGISLLTYLAVALSIGRVRALLTTALLCLMPAIAVEGYVLRPETPATLFGLLALVLLLGIPNLQPPRRGRPASGLLLAAAGVNSGLCIGFAVVAMPAAGFLLLLPGFAMVISAVQLMFRLFRVLRRRLWVVVPLIAATRRLWPWVFAALAAMIAARMLLDIALLVPEELEPRPSSLGLFPAAPWLHWPLVALAVLGGLRLLMRAGLELGRRGRLGAEAVLLLYCLLMLGQRWLRDTDEDGMPAAASVAVLIAEGIVYVFLRLAARLRRRGGRAT